MNERLKQLYKTQILTNAEDQTYFKELTEATHILEAYNPMCGDKYTLYLKMVGEKIAEASFKGYGCAISRASTSVLIKNILGKSLQELQAIIEQFMEVINEESEKSPESITADEELLAFAGTREYPERKKCASLSWDELKVNYPSELSAGNSEDLELS